MELFWEIWQQRRINEASSRTADANERITKKQAVIEHLTDRLERLTLINCAIWELVKTQNGLSDEILVSKMSEIDLRDGAHDGKINRKPSTCSSCGRNSSPRHRSCIYCGEMFEKGPF